MEVYNALGVEFFPGSGRNYPFIESEPHAIAAIEDLFISTETTPEPTLRLFSVATPRTTGADPGVRAAIHPYDLQIADSQGLRFDTRNFSYSEEQWGDNRWIAKWTAGHTSITAVFNTKNEYPGSFFVSKGYLDPRVVVWRTESVKDILLYQDGEYQSVLRSDRSAVFREGHNCDLQVSEDVALTGETVSVIATNFTPGSGLGFHPGCDVETGLTSIGGVLPDVSGNIILSGQDGCFAFEPKIDFSGSESGSIRRGEFEFRDDCDARCECQDFQRVYRYLRRTWVRYLAIAQRAEEIRDKYHELRDLMVAMKECAERRALRAVIWPVRECTFAALVGICNTTDEPLKDVELTFKITNISDGSELSEEEGPICETVHRVDQETELTMPLPYSLEDPLPLGRVKFRCVAPHSLAYVTFKANYEGQPDQELELCVQPLVIPPPLPPQEEVCAKIKLECKKDENCVSHADAVGGDSTTTTADPSVTTTTTTIPGW